MRYLGLPAAWAPQMLSVLRIATAIVFLQHAVQRLGFPHSEPQFAIGSFFWDAAAANAIAAILVLFGLFTRPVAFLAAGEMAVVYWSFNAPKSAFPLVNGGDVMILYCFVFLYLSVAGAGPWSVDAARTKGST